MSKIINLIESIKEEENKIGNLIAKSLHNSYLTGSFLSLKEISDECFVSQSTVTVFAKRLGCSGYRELILRLKMESDSFRVSDSKDVDDFDLFSEFQNSTIESLKNRLIDRDQIIKASKFIKNSKNILIAGSPQVANDASYLRELLSVKTENVFLFSREISNYMLDKIKSIESGDTLILIVSGQETKTEVDLFNIIGEIENANILVFSSESQLWKFPNSEKNNIIVINLDSTHLPHKPVFRKMQLNFLFTLLFLLC